ncbi:MAG: methyltransferase type 11 [uncultured bacterium]|nr:MAG: methyltransferase type 11 [uncultured bacterium]HBR71541.1 hypothetical protein [Candidatus Moranbacteria bacterium]
MNNLDHNEIGSSEILKCPFCNSSKCILRRIFFSELNRKEYRHYSCLGCGIEFFDPLIFENVYDNEKMGAYKEFHKGRIEYPEWTKAFLKFLKEREIILSGKKILEVGMGDGINFLALGENFNISSKDFFGIELDKKSIEVCKRRKVENIFQDFFNKEILVRIKEKFDFIIVTEVLEHQTSPRDFMDTIFKLLKKDGTIIITVPNRERFFLRFREYGDVPPHHFLRFDKSFFENNFKKDLIYLKDYSFNNKNLKNSCKALSEKIFRNEKKYILFFPIVLILRILDAIRGEGIIAVIKKN